MAEQRKELKKKMRVYKGEMVPARELNEGQSVEGSFQDAKLINITDSKTKTEKEVWRYSFRDGNGQKFVVLGRTMLDSAMEEVFEREGGMERCAGLNMRIERGSDSKLRGGRTMGNYQVSVWED